MPCVPSRAIDAPAIRDVLTALPLFDGLGNETLDQISMAASHASWHRGQALNHPGQPIMAVHLVVSGLLSRTLVTATGTERILDLCRPRECCGLGDLFGPADDPMQIVAVEDSSVISIPGRTLLAACQNNPTFSYRIARHLARKQHELESELVVSQALSANDRVLRFLMDQRRKLGQSTFSLPASKQVIAARIGLTPESFSRALRELIDAGVITNCGRSIELKDSGSAPSDNRSHAPGESACVSRAGVGQRRTVRIAELVNLAGRQRMLAERMTRTWLMVALGVAPVRAQSLLRQSVSRFEREHHLLASHPAGKAVADQLRSLASVWKRHKELLAATPRTDRAAALLDANRSVIAAADELTSALAESGGDINLRLVNLAGRQRMLVQRVAKNFILRQLKGSYDPVEPTLLTDCEHFADNLQRLTRTARDWPEAREGLRRVGLRWLGLQGVLHDEKPKASKEEIAAKVASFSERVVKDLELVVSDFEHHVGLRPASGSRSLRAA